MRHAATAAIGPLSCDCLHVRELCGGQMDYLVCLSSAAQSVGMDSAVRPNETTAVCYDGLQTTLRNYCCADPNCSSDGSQTRTFTKHAGCEQRAVGTWQCIHRVCLTVSLAAGGRRGRCRPLPQCAHRRLYMCGANVERFTMFTSTTQHLRMVCEFRWRALKQQHRACTASFAGSASPTVHYLSSLAVALQKQSCPHVRSPY